MLPYIAKRDFADVIKLRILKRVDYPELSGWAHLTTRILIRERQEIKISKRRRQCDDRSRDCSDVPQAKECWQSLEAGRAMELILPGPSTRNHTCQHLDFSPLRLIFNFEPSEM